MPAQNTAFEKTLEDEEELIYEHPDGTLITAELQRDDTWDATAFPRGTDGAVTVARGADEKQAVKRLIAAYIDQEFEAGGGGARRQPGGGMMADDGTAGMADETMADDGSGGVFVDIRSGAKRVGAAVGDALESAGGGDGSPLNNLDTADRDAPTALERFGDGRGRDGPSAFERLGGDRDRDGPSAFDDLDAGGRDGPSAFERLSEGRGRDSSSGLFDETMGGSDGPSAFERLSDDDRDRKSAFERFADGDDNGGLY